MIRSRLHIVISAINIVACALVAWGDSIPSAPAPCGAVPTDQQVNWLRMEWYAFVHFGINTYTGKEWGYGDEAPSLFAPSDFNVEIAVKAFKQAGMAGMIYTAKHHDGFCLWPTKSTKHNITKSSWRHGKGDVVAEFSKVCKKYGLKFGTYLSPWDRNNAEYGRPGYLKVYERQIRELLTNYGPIFEIWFDGANGGDGYYGGAKEVRKISGESYYNFPRIVKLIRSLQPDCIIWGANKNGDVQWGGSERGFVKYPCWNLVNMDSPLEKWISLEADTTINHAGWFWHEGQASKVKSPGQLMKVYMESVGRGANLILNVALDRRGQPDAADLASLQAFGEMRRRLLAKDYALGASATASEVRGDVEQFSAKKVTDGNIETYWCPEDNTTKNCWIEIKLNKPATFDVVRLREQIRLGQRVKKFRIEAFVNGAWQSIDDSGETIGNQVLRHLSQPVTTDCVRLTIVDARACPCISEFSLLRYPDEISPNDAPAPSAGEMSYLSTDKWTSNMKEAKKAWDGDDSTYWQSKKDRLVIDLGEECQFSGFCYLPKQNNDHQSMTDRYRFEISMDGKKWKEVASGEFPNIRANPIRQNVTFPQSVRARFVRFIGTSSLEGSGISAAELNLIK